jgi:Na+/H+ antiporter NhaD/arsenite permease-like protein
MFVVYYGMGFFGSFLSSMMSNSAAVALMLPITLPMAELMQMSPQSVAMLAPMTTSFIMLVIGCPPTIIAYSTGYFSQKEFIKIAVPWCLILLLVCTLSMHRLLAADRVCQITPRGAHRSPPDRTDGPTASSGRDNPASNSPQGI